MNRAIRYPFLLLALWVLAGPLAAATLSASVDRAQVTSGETLTLSLRLDGGQATAAPDLDALTPYFDVLGSSQSRQLRVVNGRTESFTQWDYTLSPKLEGRILIPAFELAGARSAPLAVVVKPAQYSSAVGGDYFLQLEVDRPRVYRDGQLLVTLRLNSAVPLSDLQAPPLELDWAEVKPLGEHRYERRYQGRRYGVYEQRYALFPRRAGSQTIPAQRFRALKNAPQSLFDRNRGQRVGIASIPVTVEVLAPPAGAPDPWLPAAALTLTQQLDPEQGYRVGEPISRTLTLTADGVETARLPLLALPTVAGVTVYDEPAQTEEQHDDSGLRIQRSRHFGLVPSRPGPLTLPAVRIPWWDTASDRLRVAELPALTLQVQPAAAPAAAPTPAPAPTPAGAAPEPRAAAPEPPPAWLLWSQPLWGLSLALVLGLWWRDRRALKRQTAGFPPPRQAPPASPSPAAPQTLEAACRAGDARRIRDVLLAWARRQPGWAGIRTLAALAEACPDPALAAAVRDLDRHLFAAGDCGFDGEGLWACVKGWRPPAAARPEAGLPPLYP